jgi:hypothetical protein
MKLSRPRFTVQQLMVAVAIVGLVLGIMIERQTRFRKIAAHHRAEFEKIIQMNAHPFAGSSEEAVRLEWHESMRLKYESAARNPWLSVEPDSPEPYLP